MRRHNPSVAAFYDLIREGDGQWESLDRRAPSSRKEVHNTSGILAQISEYIISRNSTGYGYSRGVERADGSRCETVLRYFTEMICLLMQ